MWKKFILKEQKLDDAQKNILSTIATLVGSLILLLIMQYNWEFTW